MLTATKQWFTLPVLISCYCFVCTQANSGSVYYKGFQTIRTIEYCAMAVSVFENTQCKIKIRNGIRS